MIFFCTTMEKFPGSQQVFATLLTKLLNFTYYQNDIRLGFQTYEIYMKASLESVPLFPKLIIRICHSGSVIKWVEDPGSIPGGVVPKTLKMVLDISLLNTQEYKVCIKRKVEQSREKCRAHPHTLM